MFRVTSQVRDVISHIYLPLTEQITYKFLNGLGLDKVFENKVHINSVASSHNKSSDENNNPIITDTRCTVNMEHSNNPLGTKWETTTFNHAIGMGIPLRKFGDHRPTFYDLETQTTLTELEVPSTVTLNFEMNFIDRVDANETANKIYTAYIDGDKFYINDLLFNYPVPEDIYTQLYGIYKLKTSDPSDFLDHLNRFSDGRIVTNVNRHDPQGSKQIVVRKTLHQSIAQIDFSEDMPSANKEGDSVKSYTVSLSITLQFSRTTMMMLSFPPVVLNKHLPKQLIPVHEDGQYKPVKSAVHPYFSFDKFNEYMENEKANDVKEVVRLPWYDPWKVPTDQAPKLFNQQEFLTAIITLDDITNENGTTVIDLEDLVSDDDMGLAPQVIDVLKDLGPSALCFDSLINVAVYVNDVPLEPSSLTLDGGTVLTIPNRHTYPVYRLVISENGGIPYGVIDTARVIRYDIVTNRQ